MSVVGIDLGTTNTVVACVRAGKVHVLADERGSRLLPSVVSFHPSGEVLVGAAAKKRRIIDPKHTVYSHKRLLGRSWGSPEIAEARQRLAFDLREGPGQGPLVHARGIDYTLPEISAFVLKRARQIAEAALGAPATRAVITVPAHFNELQRASTKVAGRVSGLEVLRILNEPTAAALAYGLGKGGSERIAVYDFGGGTFDCTLLDLNGNVFEVLATAGDSFLGGDDVDNLIAERMADTYLKAHRYDPRTDPQMYERLKTTAEDLKIALSQAPAHTVVLEEFGPGVGGRPVSFAFTLSRGELDALATPLVDRTFQVTQEALSLARLTPSSFDRVILVGGSTRIPLVRRRVEAFFGAPPLDRINPDEVVAIGAAIQAAALTEGTRRRSIPAPPSTSSSRPAAPLHSTSPPSFGTVEEPPELASVPDFPSFAMGASTGEAPHAGAMPGGQFGAVPDLSLITSSGMTASGAVPSLASGPAPALSDGRPSWFEPTSAQPSSSDDGQDTEVQARSPLSRPPQPGATGSRMHGAPPVRPAKQPFGPMQRLPDRTEPASERPPPTRTFPPPAVSASSAQPAPPLPTRDRTVPLGTTAPSVQRTTPLRASPPGGTGARPPTPAPPPLPPAVGAATRSSVPPAHPAALPPLPPEGVPHLPLGFGEPIVTAPMPAVMPGLGRGATLPPPGGQLGLAAPVLVDVTPRGLVVETAGGFSDTVIPRNAKIPCERTRRFSTGRDMQTTVRIRVAQGESQVFAQNTYLGEVQLTGLRAAPRGGVIIGVNFEVDADGTLRVRARDIETGLEAQAVLQLVAVADESSVVMMINRFAQQPVVGDTGQPG